MHCNTEAECTQLVQLLPATEAALLDWAVNLMADVVQHEHQNKMNARNIAMVFAPNMTQMADPLTALIHAVQVMNFLKTLIMKILREREENAARAREFSFCPESPKDRDRHNSSRLMTISNEGADETPTKSCFRDTSVLDMFLRNREDGLLSDAEESFRSLPEKFAADDEVELFSAEGSARKSQVAAIENGCRGRYISKEVESLLDRFNLRKGVRKICARPMFHSNRVGKKSNPLGIVNSAAVAGGEAWA
ncbi:unnamed protein product [Victoria cruziana]